MMVSRAINREICDRCCKNILKHNRILVCSQCDKINHSKCGIKKFTYDQLNDVWSCEKCNKPNNNQLIYTPFSSMIFNKFVDDDSQTLLEEVQIIKNVLKNCKEYNIKGIKSPGINDKNHIVDSLPILFNNIDGMSSNFDTLHALLSTTNLKFGVIALAETNIDPCHKGLYNIPEYQSIFGMKQKGKHKGSGLGLYIHNSMVFEEINDLCICSKDFESLIIKIDDFNTPIYIGVVYRPPNGNFKEFLEHTDKLLSTLPSNSLITGDFNINLFNTENKTKQFEDTIYGNSYVPTISLPTHFKPGCSPSCIDNILVTNPEDILMSGVLKENVSHHHPIVTMYRTPYVVKPPDDKDTKISQPLYDYNESNITEFNKKLSDKLFITEFTSDELGFERFVYLFNETLEDTCRTEPSTSTSKRNRHINPWITNGLIKSINHKTFLYHKWKSTCNKKLPKGDESTYNKYKGYRKQLKYLINHTKKQYHSKKFDNVKGDSKKTWKLINELRGKDKNRCKPHFIINGSIVQNRRAIANEFNLYFNSIASNLNAQIVTANGIMINPLPSFHDYLDRKIPNSIFMKHCTTNEIVEIIKDFDGNKTSDISVHLLKKCSNIISPYLSSFYTLFMESGTFPRCLKYGHISPVFKKGNPQLIENYRPISTLPCFGKIFEKVIYTRFYSFLTANKILHENQFGFRRKHSTSHAVNYSIDRIVTEIENNKHVLGIFIDLSKAFDTICHKSLLYKLEHYGIRGNANLLIQSYLSERTQLVNFDGTKSTELYITDGVPQGSVLGPLLFIVFINDIVRSSNLGDFVMFADDTNIFVSASSEHEVYHKANLLLSQIDKYMLSNQLHINLGKCVYMHFKPSIRCSSNKNHKPSLANISYSLQLNGIEISKVNKARFLGIIIDEKLDWQAHIDSLIEKLNSCIITIKRIKKFIPKEHYPKLYHSLFKSHLIYGITAWGGVCYSKLNKLFAIQKRCIRLLFGKVPNFDHIEFYQTCARARSYDEHIAPKNFVQEHTKPIFKELNLLSVYHLYNLFMFTELFKIQKYSSPTSLLDKLSPSSRYSCDTLKLRVPKYNKKRSRIQFLYKGTELWNMLYSKVFQPPELDTERHVIIPGAAKNSDFTSTLSFVKNTIRKYLGNIQASGNTDTWIPQSNFRICHTITTMSTRTSNSAASVTTHI